MSIDVKIPAIGESVTEVTLGAWQKQNGDYVDEGDVLCEVESEKATLELSAESSGTLNIMESEGTDLPIHAVIAKIEPGQNQTNGKSQNSKKTATTIAPQPNQSTEHLPSPAAKKILNEKGIDPKNLSGTGHGGRITKQDALLAQKNTRPTTTVVNQAINAEPPKSYTENAGTNREIKYNKMSRLRRTIATKLTEAKNSTAMLTTFNEVDMFAIKQLRQQHQEKFVAKHMVKLGFMSLFTKACTTALQSYPMINTQIAGEHLMQPQFVDMGIAVSSQKGLVVPVLRNAEEMSLAKIELSIKKLAEKARNGNLTLEEMSGGTFTITNGGTFGSMLSTPIINIPQSAILGMHNIVERPWVVDGKIEIRPIMYVALSYDHRIIDGKDSVGFLKTVKELLEDPSHFDLNL